MKYIEHHTGEACAFRNGIISEVHELADDSNIALQVISKGYRAVVNEEAYFTESPPTELADYFTVKSRRALRGLNETLRFKSINLPARTDFWDGHISI